MKSLTFCLAVTFSFSALASTSITGNKKVFENISLDLDMYGQETKFEVMKNGYETARAIPTPLDFEVFDLRERYRSQYCVLAEEKYPEELHAFIVARYSVKVSSTPGNGPMSPGTSDRTETKVLVGRHGIFDDRFFSVFINETSNTDFVVRVPENNVGLYSDIGGGINIYFRKEKNVFPFKVVKLQGGNGQQFPAKESVLYYGYCYDK